MAPEDSLEIVADSYLDCISKASGVPKNMLIGKNKNGISEIKHRLHNHLDNLTFSERDLIYYYRRLSKLQVIIKKRFILIDNKEK